MQNLTSRLLKLSAIGLCVFATVTASARDCSKEMKEVVPPPQCPPWYFSIGAGAEFDTGATDYVSAGQVFMPDFGGDLFDVKSVSFEDAHNVTSSIRAEFGYHINPSIVVFAGFTYNHANGNETGLGTTTIDGSDFVLRGHFGDYDAYAGRGGFKLYAPDDWMAWSGFPLKSYMTFSLGGKYVDSGEANFFVAEDPFFSRLRAPDFYNSCWVFTTDFQIGFEYKVACCATIGVETGIGYDSKLSRGSRNGEFLDADLFENYINNGVNEGGDRLYIPVSLYAKVRF